MDELTLDGKTYISSKFAAKITGYAKDYVGQLCREGRVDARLVGRNWYVLEDSIREHRFGKEIAVSGAQAPLAPKDPLMSTWEAPRYSFEENMPSAPLLMAPEASKPNVRTQESGRIAADMQTAWKEWFDRREPVATTVPDNIDVEVSASPDFSVTTPYGALPPQTFPSEIINDEAIFGGSLTARQHPDTATDEEIYDEKPENIQNDVGQSSEIINDEAIFGGSLTGHIGDGDFEQYAYEATSKEPKQRYLETSSEYETVPITTFSSKQTMQSRDSSVVDLARIPSTHQFESAPKSAFPTKKHSREALPTGSSNKSSAVISKALLVSLAGLAIAVTLVGSGLADEFVNDSTTTDGLQEAVLKILRGESSFKKSLIN